MLSKRFKSDEVGGHYHGGWVMCPIMIRRNLSWYKNKEVVIVQYAHMMYNLKISWLLEQHCESQDSIVYPAPFFLFILLSNCWLKLGDGLKVLLKHFAQCCNVHGPLAISINYSGPCTSTQTSNKRIDCKITLIKGCKLSNFALTVSAGTELGDHTR